MAEASSNGGKSFSVVAIITMLVGFATIWNVMNSQVNSLKADLSVFEKKLEEHKAIEAHYGALTRFGRVEEQMATIKERHDHIAEVINMNRQEENNNIRMLWEKVFGVSMPSDNYYPLAGVR